MKSWRAISVFAATVACVFSAALLWPHAARTEQPSLSTASAPSVSSAASAQQISSSQTPTIEEYNPKSTLVVPEHKIERAKFPFIDIHSHHWNPTPEHVDQLVREMDTINLRVLVNLSGGTGEELQKNPANLKRPYSDRFLVVSDSSYDDIHTSR